MKTVLLLLVLGLLIAWFFYRRGLDSHENRRNRPDSPVLTDHSKYHAVSVKHGANACAAVSKISGQRFLASQAPDLPLPGCDADQCDCRFIHHDDRRSGKDRRSPFTPGGVAAATGSYAGERRQSSDRRDESDDY